MPTKEMPPQVQAVLDKGDAFLAKYPNLLQYDKLQQLEDKVGYSKVFFAAAFALVFSSAILALGGLKFISDLIAFLYPAYMSFKAIDSPDPSKDTQWLTYWVVFSFFSIIETTCSFFISWIPFYFFIKLGFFLWLYHPQFLGAEVLYNQVLKPCLIPYLNTIGSDAAVQKKTS
jgi:receptor expression-enhancing protein 5/6|uniref:Receptor expression-enhancing protein n=1 Tax=Attheya septentrionalis TaxID=420275 RepID=A0A7S2UQE6_9STRA|mmetsp:Transcript_5675/g.10002  ORF Transcript_5675/g.10002 Transcript_5675/m.10002 type:complete len:173 (+) Transcript_5675:100-618(+)|eukprot:CAMPEP_0198287214 /NCGR_PEP_ID=MMETSP1449-20131203/6107_1 /TAXON_ID=420275 /ORGANISM="Attheya septentrionalis, Strain CCMP2084" /LENGTH=172 /DNA_ID=CAMNT_0043985139 /DNA_START=56 /DNA_END=574 /DNA_ORIENTATION=+